MDNKHTAFMDIKRQEGGYRPVKQRLADFEAVETRLPEEDLVDQARRCMDCGIPFCHGYGCPLANIIPEWNELVYRKRWRDALRRLMSTNNFPEFTARICPAPCEAACVAGIHFDPVVIREIELFVIEKGFERGWIRPDLDIERNGRTAAVVGSGPAGLAVADELNKKGYRVTVFETDTNPGGILRYGIPDFKLEKWVVERRISLMQQEGVVFETGVCAGVDISSDYLMKKFDAVCLACGAREPRDLQVPGRELKGIHHAMEFLTMKNRLISREIHGEAGLISAKDKNVVVIGGGDTGSDCVGTALRQGAKKVVQLEIMPKPPQKRPDSTPWPEWPVILRTTSSHKEGCTRNWNVSTTFFTGENDHVKKLRGESVAWEKDAKGKLTRFKSKPGTSFELEADLVLLAMGFTGPEKDNLLKGAGVKTNELGLVGRDEKGLTNIDKVFVAGDMTHGASLVVTAMADGRRVAGLMDGYVKNK